MEQLYLSNFWRSLEMPMINCSSIEDKVPLKIRRTKHCVLASAGVENKSANYNNIILTMEDFLLQNYISLS